MASLLLVAGTDRYFADGGHALDFINKAFECLDVIGWTHAPEVLPSVVEHLVTARGSEEANAWRHPVDLILLCDAAFAKFPGLVAEKAARRDSWHSHAALACALLGDDPQVIVTALLTAIKEGAKPTDLSRALAYSSALRVARFGTANEHSDWLSAHHCFTYCNALHQLLKRASTGSSEGPARDPLILRGIFHGAMRVYLTRFLNVPPAPLPSDSPNKLVDLPKDPIEICRSFLAALDRQGAVEDAARLIARYLMLGHPVEPLIATLARAVLREDADFHTYQMLEAGVQQYREWGHSVEGLHILIAMARYLAAHSPTERSQLQTATVARRLQRGQSLHEDAAEVTAKGSAS
jgi:hypothetical protein